jgi:predicted small metal-binding protein
MAKVVRCRDVGFDCEGVISAETEEEALAQAAAHVQSVHGLEEVTPEVVAQVCAVMRDE